MHRKLDMYYMTVNPDPKKIATGHKAYSNLEARKQRDLIMKYINKASRWCKKKMGISKIHFELTNQKRVHAHFSLLATSLDVQRFQVFLNECLGNTRYSPEICVHFMHHSDWRPKVNPATEKPYKSWDEYCNKENVFEPTGVLCQCVICLYERNDKVISKKVEYGDIVLEMDDMFDDDESL